MKIKPFLTNFIITPHGITDIGHSIQKNNLNNLFKIYGINFIFTDLISNININFSNKTMYKLLFISSIYHFRHDLPKIKFLNNIIPRALLSTLMLFVFYFFNSNLLIYYMAFIHVPNHFKLNNFHIKNIRFLNIFLYLLFGILSEIYLNKIFLSNNLKFNNYIISIIISHILYQELYVINNN